MSSSGRLNVEGELDLTPEQIANLSPEEILKALDSSWLPLLEPVQVFLENLWNSILKWLYELVDWIWDKLKPAFDKVWNWIKTEVGKVHDWIKTEVGKVHDWIKTEVGKVYDWIKTEVGKVYDWIKTTLNWLWKKVSDAFDTVGDWIKDIGDWLWRKIQDALKELGKAQQSLFKDIKDKVGEINTWFSQEFIDPFIDWLVAFPGKFFDGLVDKLFAVLDKIGEWFTHHSPGFWGWYRKFNDWITSVFPTILDESRGIPMLILGGLAQGLASVWPFITPYLSTFFSSVGAWLVRAGPAIGSWFLVALEKVGGWLVGGAWVFAGILDKILPGIFTYLGKHWVGLAVPATILGLEATGVMDDLVKKYVTPLFIRVFEWAERMGPVSPTSGKNIIDPLSGMIEMTISGLATMTLAGETLGFWKHIGMGHLSAMIYDLTNYKVLTAAFVGVLAGIYIKTPLTYYYQKIARPNIPEQRDLLNLASEYMLAEPGDVEGLIRGQVSFEKLAEINEAKFVEMMAWHGLPDEWSRKLFQQADTPMRYFALSAVARTGIWDEELFIDELRNSGYSARGCTALLDAFRREATGELRTLMVGAAMKRFREGFDDESTLAQNLQVLGVSPTLMPKYLYAAQLDYLTDYQFDLISYYKDAYHRREIEEDEFRRGLVSCGLATERIDVLVDRENTKRLKVVTAEVTEVPSIKIDTIRRQRRKLLIDHDQEIAALIKIGVSTSDAEAIADNDDVRLAGKAEVE